MKTNRNQVNVTAAFKATLKNALANEGRLTQQKSADIALATISAMHKDDGSLLNLTVQQKDWVKMMFYPTVTARLSFIKSMLGATGCTLDTATQELLNGLFTPANLEKKVKKAREEAPVINWSEMMDEEGPAQPEEHDAPSSDDQASDDGEDQAQSEPVQPPKADGKNSTATK